MNVIAEAILKVRHTVVFYFKHYEGIALFILKLLAGVCIFRFINTGGLADARFAPLFAPPLDFPYIVLSAALFAVLPAGLGNTLIALEALIQISSSLEALVYGFVMLALVLLLYVRLQPKRSYLIIAVIIGFKLNMPYVVVMFAGLYLGLASIAPCVLAAAIWKFAPLFLKLAREYPMPEKIDILELPESFVDVYKTLYYEFTAQSGFSWIYMGFSFAMVIAASYVISRLFIDRAKELAVILSGVVNIVCLAIGATMKIINLNIGEVIIYTLLSVIILIVICFFDIMLDYSAAERVSFEDDENYYQVKVIPKVLLKRNTRR